MSQKYFSMFLLLCVLLTACAAQRVAPTATVVPTVTATLPPTSALAPTETPIPSPTATATPQPLPPELDAFAKELEANNYTLGYSKVEGNEKNVVMFYVDPETQIKTEVSEIVINPDQSGTRTYMFDNPEGEPEQVVVDYKKEQLLEGNFSAWKLVEGKLVKKNAIITDPKGESIETNILLYSDREKVPMVIAATKKIREEYNGTIPNSYGELSRANLDDLGRRMGLIGTGTIKLENYSLIPYFDLKYNKRGKGYNRIYTKNLSGNYDLETYDFTTLYGYTTVNKLGDVGLLLICSLNKDHKYLIDEPLLSIHDYSKPNSFRKD